MTSCEDLRAERDRLQRIGAGWRDLDPPAPTATPRPKRTHAKTAAAAATDGPTVAEQRRAHYRSSKGAGRIEHTTLGRR